MKILRKSKVGRCLMTGIKAHNRFLGYSTNPGLTDPDSGPTEGTNQMTERYFGKADRGWILYGLMSKSRNRFIGYCVVEEGAT